MYIKSIEMNGFKSYGNRTEVKGFDPYFNAITGLNGSGKSNILDSICFVLGITNLSQVRANSLQELVYKNGQAGINKASVSITFDNSDPKCSPVGYEDVKEITVTRIIAIGGKNKYLINGGIAHNHRVLDFFQSVQLNVNNPHFLIMQGRITKVLNMKPLEILSMVEEAAGTRMYEKKKESSLRLIAKKDEKLDEITKIFQEEINPNMEKLRNERKDFVEYTKVCRDLEHATKLQVAWQFLQAQKMCDSSKVNALKYKEEYAATKKKNEELSNTIKTISERLTEMEKQKNEEVGGKLHSLEATLKERQMDETKFGSTFQTLKSALTDNCKKKAQLVKNLNEDKNALVKKHDDVKRFKKKVEDLKVAQEADAQAVAEAEKSLHDVNAGLIKDKEGRASTIANQIIEAEGTIKRSETEIKTSTMALANLKKELSKKQSTCSQMDTSYKSAHAAFQTVEKERNNLKSQMDKIGYDENKLDELKRTKISLEKETNVMKLRLEELESRFPQLNFDYVDPEKNFDRRRVCGLVCKLITLKDHKTATALELAAGGKLQSIVVDNDKTAKLLLERGQLRRRVTFIPLNKIIGHPIKDEVVRRAKTLVGKENVDSAISLVSYDSKLLPAMEFVFGSTFICSDMESAKKVAFGEGIKTRSVTLEGEVFDPAGTLSGGSMNNRTKLLAEMSKMKDMSQEFHMKNEQLMGITKQLQVELIKAQKFEALQEKFEMKESELKVQKAKMEKSNYHQEAKEIENLKKTIEEHETRVTESREAQKKAEQRLKELKQIDSKSALQNEVKKVEKFLTDCQKKAAASEKEYKKAVQDLEQTQLEINDITQSIENCEQQIENLVNTIKTQEEQVRKAEEELREKKSVVQELISEVKSQKSALKAHCSEITKLASEKEGLLKNIEDNKLHLQQLEHDIEKCDTDAEEAEKNVDKYLSTYDWIEEEQRYFGQPNTEYDFSKYNAREAMANHKRLEEAKQRLSKCINVRAQNMLANAEEQYQDLLAKRNIVLRDKKQIENAIKELDEKKCSVLRNACVKANQDFGSIFSTLLPGAKAKLIPSEDRSVLEGLEFRVGFGGVWKESLTELSGGQRSLVALSLILSLLMFNPAPIYILDEVDAALDLSHTQNIGQMLKRHFQTSQFIVVSLKDGMYDNANVLFRTQFIDGMSTVIRTVPRRK